MTNQTHFGFTEIPVHEKTGRVRGVFDAVASRYDIMNDAMSFGLHRVWKSDFIAQLGPTASMRLLDLAGGTGDIALRAYEKNCREITVCDINANMLLEGRDRFLNKGITEGVRWACGNAESLPFPDKSFDACSIAFGIRNMTDIDKALREIRRVLKTGGRFLCLEFSKVSNETLARLYDFYSFNLIPQIGEKIAGDAAPYQYLVESIRQFPNAPAFEQRIRQAGFENTSHRKLSGGVVAIHSSWKL